MNGCARRRPPGTRARDVSIVEAATGKRASLWPYLSAGPHSLLIFEDEGRTVSVNGAAKDAGDRLQILHVNSRSDPTGKVRTRYRLSGPGWVLVRPDQVVAARGVGGDFSALHAYAAQVLRPSAGA